MSIASDKWWWLPGSLTALAGVLCIVAAAVMIWGWPAARWPAGGWSPAWIMILLGVFVLWAAGKNIRQRAPRPNKPAVMPE